MSKFYCYFDGACDCNPGGNMGMGVVIKDDNNETVFTKSDMVPRSFWNTNNVAEHIALKKLLEYFIGKENNEIYISGDSQMVINQASGRMKMKTGSYVKHGKKTLALLGKIKEKNDVFVRWIPREENEEADALSKKALVGVNRDSSWVKV